MHEQPIFLLAILLSIGAFFKLFLLDILKLYDTFFCLGKQRIIQTFPDASGITYPSVL